MHPPALVVFAAWTLVWGASGAALALVALGYALALVALGALAGGLAGLALALLGMPGELVVDQGRVVLLVGALAAVGGATLAQLRGAKRGPLHRGR